MKKLYSSYLDYLDHSGFTLERIKKHWNKLLIAVAKRVEYTCTRLNISDSEFLINDEKRKIIINSRKGI